MSRLEVKVPINVDGFTLAVGVNNNVPEKVMSHYVVKAMLENGDAKDLDAVEVVEKVAELPEDVEVVEDENPELPEDVQVEDLDTIKEKLDFLGVPYGPRIGLKKAKAALDKAMKRKV